MDMHRIEQKPSDTTFFRARTILRARKNEKLPSLWRGSSLFQLLFFYATLSASSRVDTVFKLTSFLVYRSAIGHLPRTGRILLNASNVFRTRHIKVARFKLCKHSLCRFRYYPPHYFHDNCQSFAWTLLKQRAQMMGSGRVSSLPPLSGDINKINAQPADSERTANIVYASLNLRYFCSACRR